MHNYIPINDRAAAYAEAHVQGITDTEEHDRRWWEYYDTYVQIATEQRTFDVIESSDWLHSTIGDGFVRYGSFREVADNSEFAAMYNEAMYNV